MYIVSLKNKKKIVFLLLPIGIDIIMIKITVEHINDNQLSVTSD